MSLFSRNGHKSITCCLLGDCDRSTQTVNTFFFEDEYSITLSLSLCIYISYLIKNILKNKRVGGDYILCNDNRYWSMEERGRGYRNESTFPDTAYHCNDLRVKIDQLLNT